MTAPTELVLSGDIEGSVTVRKHTTPNGSRLAIILDEGPESRLDALELESLTWQEEGFLDDRSSSTPARRSPADLDPIEPPIKIGNEYALVEVSAIELSDSDGLLVSSVKMGFETVLRPRELVILTQKDASYFSELLETPFGPEPDDLVEFH